MANINDYIGDCKFDFTEQEKKLMDIFAESWEHCHASSCENCEFNNGNKRYSLLLCMSYQYAKKLIDNGYKDVRHGRNIEDTPSLFECSLCGWSDYDLYTSDTGIYNYCPNCGARMDGGDKE